MTAFCLRIIALVSMLCDHVGRTILSDEVWLTYIGRLAFPIFAYQLVEGYAHTRDIHKYSLRLLACALTSEIPFDLMLYGECFGRHQNVLWTLLLGLIGISLTDKVLNTSAEKIVTWTCMVMIISALFTIAVFLRVDYSGMGVLQIFLFFLLRKSPFSCLVFTTFLLNCTSSIGPYLPSPASMLPIQSLATLALLPIRFYNGSPGYHSKAWTWFCYLFYPLHMTLLALLVN